MKPILIKLCFIGFLLTLSVIVQAQKIGLLLDSYVTDRWYLDEKLFTDKVKQLGGECMVEVAYGDSDEQLKLAGKLLESGIDVLAVVPTDATKAADIVKLAKIAGVPVISYDRLILSDDIAVYISYNNEKVGRLQAEYALKRFPKGKYILINGPVSDNNAVMFRQGQLSILKSAEAKGQISILEDYIMTDWSEIGAFEKMKDILASGREMPDVIIAANDAVANGVIQALPPALAGKIVVTGQDADLRGIRNIITGTQAMTIYKPIRPLAYRAAEMAMTLAHGKVIEGLTRMGKSDFFVNALLLDPIVVDKSNYKETVIKDGHASLSEVLKNLGSVFEQERSKIQLSLLQKEKALEVEKHVNQRNIFIVIISFFLFSIVGLAFTIYHKQKDNRLLNDQKKTIETTNSELHTSNEKLQSLNEELLQKQEEISAQRDAIADQKEKLEEVNAIIEQQKNAIVEQNETLEEEVQKRTADLVQYNRQLEQYAFITAHNLRAPVARIIGLGQLLRLDQSDMVETRFIIDKLLDSSEELDSVIKELNAILDIRTFSVEVLTKVDLSEQVTNIMASLKSDIEHTKAVIKTDFRAVNDIFSIKPYIHSIIFNLVSNAIKYRAADREPVITLKTEKVKNQVCLSVSDNGIGIDLDSHHDMIFQLYKRFHFHAEGRGIGLFLVKTQIDSLGGNVQIESKVGKGTTFRIFLNNHTKGSDQREKKEKQKQLV
jgi:D-xylose ABC transporter substrate-binding protein